MDNWGGDNIRVYMRTVKTIDFKRISIAEHENVTHPSDRSFAVAHGLVVKN